MNTTDKIAVCSRSFSVNPALRKEILARYQNVTFNDSGAKLEGDSLVSFLRGHDKAITALERIDEYVLSRLPELKVIGKFGVGLDMIDTAAMRKNGVRLGWTGGVNRRAVAELALSFAITMLRNVLSANGELRAGTSSSYSGALLSGRTVGIIGCGNIGKDLVKLLQPFGCKVMVNDIREYKDFYEEFGVDAVELDTLLMCADVVTLHVPIDASTKGMLNKDRLALLQAHAVLINTARGGLVDEAALKSALKEKRIASAAFDVFTEEPLRDKELLNLPNFLATPHIAGSTHESIVAMGKSAIHGLDVNEITTAV